MQFSAIFGWLPQFQNMGLFDSAILRRGSKSQYVILNPHFVLEHPFLIQICEN
jgi:hypothetical protein